MTGTLVLGNYSKIFTALPQHYTITDFDIHIEDSTKSYQNIQSLVAISGELARSGIADLGDITNIMTSNSITELKRYIDRSIDKKKKENDMIGQLQQQLQQAQQGAQELEKANKQLQDQLAQLEQKLQSSNEAKLQIEAEKVKIEQEKVKNDKEYNDKVIEVKEKQVQAQVLQIYDSNPYNDKIKSVI